MTPCTCLPMGLVAIAIICASPLLAYQGKDPCQLARAVTQTLQRTQAFYEADAGTGEDADAAIEAAVRLWQDCLAEDGENLEAHRQISELLSQLIGRAWQRGEPTDSESLKPLWARVAHHRERVMVLTGGKEMRKDEVAEAYMQAGDFAKAERLFGEDGDRLALFFFYVGAGRWSAAEAAFGSLVGFESRYLAASRVLNYHRRQDYEVALHCANRMLADGYSAHRRAALYRVLAEANIGLGRWDAAIATSSKAVQLNPGSPWGWCWLARANKGAGLIIPSAAARRHELSLLTGGTGEDSAYRSQVCAELGELYQTQAAGLTGARAERRYLFETAIRYYQQAISEALRLPPDPYGPYRDARCSAAFMNILSIVSQGLCDPARGRLVLESARTTIPSFPNEVERNDLRRMGLELTAAEKSN